MSARLTLAEAVDVLLDQAQPGEPYPLRLRERIGEELAALRLTTAWSEHGDRYCAATGMRLASTFEIHQGDDVSYTGRIVARDLDSRPFVALAQARAWVDAHLRAEGWVTAGSRAPRPGQRAVLFAAIGSAVFRGVLAATVPSDDCGPLGTTPALYQVRDLSRPPDDRDRLGSLCALEAEYDADDRDLTTTLREHLARNTEENP